MTIEDYAERNRQAWNQVAPIHRRARKKDLRLEVQGPDFNVLEEVERKLLRQIGVQGKRVAQLCCNNGRELISIVRMGASFGLGFDISDEVVAEAQELSSLAGTECDFVRTDVLEIAPDQFDPFDIVFISIGALTWLHRLRPLFEIVARLLVPGGHLLIHEMHPFLDMLATKLDDEYDPQNELKIAYSYFSKEPWIDEQGLDYVGDTTYDSLPSISFPHTLSDIFSAIIDSGLVVTHFREYPRDISAVFAHLEQYGLSPLSYSLTAQKPTVAQKAEDTPATGKKPEDT
jgi:SAM-dependent methyltransferase